MSALDKFLNDNGYRLINSHEQVLLEKKRKLNWVSIIIGGSAALLLIILGLSFQPVALLAYIIALIIILIVFRFNYRGVRPIVVFDWTHTTMVKRSVYFFLNSVTVRINGYQGVDIRVKDWVSQSSEGVDEYQKTIFIKTAEGDIDVVDFYTEKKEIEPELRDLSAVIAEFLGKKKS